MWEFESPLRHQTNHNWLIKSITYSSKNKSQFSLYSITTDLGSTLGFHFGLDFLSIQREIMRNHTYISRGKKPYQQYQFRCIIPKDLEDTFSTKEFRISLKSSLYSHSKIISTNLYNISQFIFGEVRGGYMKDITIEDVKNILRGKVKQTVWCYILGSPNTPTN